MPRKKRKSESNAHVVYVLWPDDFTREVLSEGEFKDLQLNGSSSEIKDGKFKQLVCWWERLKEIRAIKRSIQQIEESEARAMSRRSLPGQLALFGVSD